MSQVADKEAKACWEFWNCPEAVRNYCPAYTGHAGQACWLVAQSYCVRLMKDYMKCEECPWYKRVNLEKSSRL